MDFIDNNISSPFENYANEILGWPINFYENSSSNDFDFTNMFVEKTYCNEEIQSKKRFLFNF